MITPYVRGRTNRQAFAVPAGYHDAMSTAVDLLVKDAGLLVVDGEREIAATDAPGGRDAQDARAELTRIRALATSMTSGRVGA